MQRALGCVRPLPHPLPAARPPEEAVEGARLAVADDGCAQVDEHAAGIHHLRAGKARGQTGRLR